MPIAIHRTQGHHTSTPERWNKGIIYFFFRPGESPPPARADDTTLWGTMLRTLLTCLLGLNAVLPAASIGPRVVSQEEILEMIDREADGVLGLGVGLGRGRRCVRGRGRGRARQTVC